MTFNFVERVMCINGGDVPSPIQFYRKGFTLGGKTTPSWKEITLSGIGALTLVNAIDEGLLSLLLFGNTELLSQEYLDTVTLSGGCEQRNLPSGFTQVEYLEVATINAYFSTGINATVDTDMGVIASNITSNSAQILVAECGSGGDYFRIAKAGASQRLIGTLGSSTVTDNNTEGIDKFTARVNKSGFYVNGSLIGTFSDIPSSLTDVGEIDIFRGKYGNAIYYAYLGSRFHGAWVNDNIFLPCRRNSDNSLGIYNTKTGQFILPSGEGTFTAGADVTTPTPDYPMDIVCNNGAIKVNRNLYSTEYHDQTLSQSDGVTTSSNIGVNVSAMVNCTNIKSFMVTSADPKGSYRLFKYRPDRTFISAGIVSSVGQVLVLPSDCGYFRIQYVYAGTGTENILIYNSAYPNGIYTDGTQEVVTDSLGNTASAEMLLAVGDYKDTQEVISGAVTRRCGVLVLNGTEDWTYAGVSKLFFLDGAINGLQEIHTCYCTHYQGVVNDITTASNSNKIKVGSSTTPLWDRIYVYADTDVYTDATLFKAYLAQQYAQGTPVIVVYPTSSATTSSVTEQFLSKSPVTQTAGSISNLPIAITESEKTVPTPQQPLQINCNNGVVKVSKNLFNANVVLGSTIDTSGMDGNPNPARARLEYLYLPTGTYTISNNGNTVNQILGASYSDNTGSNFSSIDVWAWHSLPFTFTLTSNRYVRFMVRNSSDVELTTNNIGKFQLELGSTVTPYHPYVEGGIYTDGTTETVEITGKNLFDKNSITEGHIYNAQLEYVTSDIASLSDYIPVVAGQSYTFTGYKEMVGNFNIRVNYFDANKEIQSQDVQVVVQGDYNFTITIPSGIKYLRYSFRTEMVDTQQLELGSTATTYEPYYYGGSATAEDLLAVGTYKDEQNITTGDVTRKVGVKVLDGTETSLYYYGLSSSGHQLFYYDIIQVVEYIAVQIAPVCSHYQSYVGYASTMPNNAIRYQSQNQGSESNFGRVYMTDDRFDSLTSYKTWLSTQYANGTPVIIVYNLQTPTTSSVTAQDLTLQAGTNLVEITEASMDNLPLEVSYKAGVSVTITEVEDAQLDDNVEVTING